MNALSPRQRSWRNWLFFIIGTAAFVCAAGWLLGGEQIELAGWELLHGGRK